MNEMYVVDKEFLFKNNIYEVTSISIEPNYYIEGSVLAGEFLISGDYRLHEVSINKEDFSFKLPFRTEIKSNINLDSINLEITDFTYNVNSDEISVHVEYLVTGEQSLIEFAEESDLEDFLKHNEAEIIDLSDDIRDEEITPFEEQITEAPILEELVIEDEREEERNTKDEVDGESIVEAIKSEESFITYHVHTVTENDTMEGICNKYRINVNDLKKMNDIEDLAINMKLIIADEED